MSDRLGRHGEHVGRRREEPERDVTAFGQQAYGQRVDGAGDPDVGRAVRVDVVAEHQRPVDADQPVSDGRDVVGQVESRLPGQLLVVLGRPPAIARLLAGDRNEQGPTAAPCGLEHSLPDGRAGQVDPDHPGSPAQEHRQRPHLGPRAERHDRAARQGKPLRTGGDRPHGVRA
jgi:hypothetical protein